MFALKHIDAICAFVAGNTNPSEPIDTRFADEDNYLDLGYALIEEARMAEVATPAPTTNRVWQGSDIPLLKHIPLTFEEQSRINGVYLEPSVHGADGHGVAVDPITIFRNASPEGKDFILNGLRENDELDGPNL